MKGDKMITVKHARQELARVHMTLRREDEEYCVNFANGEEKTAYYTDDLQDAVVTGRRMAEKRAALKEETEVSVIRAMLRIMRYDEFQAKALCASVAKAIIEDRKLSESASEAIMDYVSSMSRVTETAETSR